MQLRSGVPLISDLDQLKADPYYAQITGYSREFLAKHSNALAGYGKLWGQDPFKLWSRRWEYPFAARKTIDYGRAHLTPIKVIDAGSGVTFFPYYVCEQLSDAQVICIDSNPSYPPMFEAINRAVENPRVSFSSGMLQKLDLADASIDVVCCISVLEHTDNYGEIVREFARVLKPGGLLVLTFDLSLDGKFELRKEVAGDLLNNVSERFEVGDISLESELNRMDTPADILTTDFVKATEPELLPWRFPLAKAAHDLIKGHGWTGGFRSKSVFCISAAKK